MALEEEDRVLIFRQGEIKTPPFSDEARVEAGMLLRQLQKGISLSLPHSRPMSGIGSHCHELRIVDEGATWRIIYVLDPDAVVVLDVFKKKDRKTPQLVIDNCKKRLRQYRKLTQEN